MAQTQERNNQQVTVYEDTSWERLLAGETGRLIGYVRPWLGLGAAFGAGAVSHALWGHDPHLVPWAASAYSVSAVAMPGFAWFASRLAPFGRAHTAFSVASLMAWLDVATIAGAATPATGAMAGILGGLLALSWNIRGHARARAANPNHNPNDRLAALFADASKEVGMSAKLNGIALTPSRATATVQLEDGKTAADLLHKVPAIESAAALPPGSITTTTDPDRADRAGFVLSDPRVLTRPVPWPGPSAPGASIGEPLRVGMWQDGEPVMYKIVGHHIYMMGMSGSGKSMGGAWNILGEAMTRPDVAILMCDTTKGFQTAGPLLPGINRFERTKKGAASLIADIHGIIQARTDYLASKGLQKWEPGCGLSYLICWFEETGQLMTALGSRSESQMDAMATTLRSAGGSLVHSLQRNTYDQLNTLVRAQMSSMCFGLSDPNDAKYGLSEAQQNAGVPVAEWKDRYPGRAVLDAPTIPEDRITMPLRAFHWGEGKPASDAMLAHANAWPVSMRPVDPITAQICGAPVAENGPVTGKSTAAPATVTAPARPSVTLTAAPEPAPAAGPAGHPDEDQDPDEDRQAADGYADDDEDPDQDPEDIGDPVGEVLAGVEDPSPDITAAVAASDYFTTPIGPEPGDQPFEFVTGPKMSPAESRQVLARQLDAWREAGRESFRPGDFKDVMKATGNGRTWVQKVLGEYIDADDPVIERDDSGPERCYRFRTPATV
jgi:hypothetical protein